MSGYIMKLIREHLSGRFNTNHPLILNEKSESYPSHIIESFHSDLKESRTIEDLTVFVYHYWAYLLQVHSSERTLDNARDCIYDIIEKI